MRMSSAEMKDELVRLGLKRKYKPFQEESETERILLKCRRPVTIIDGLMRGVEMDIYDSKTVRIWTSQKNKAAKCGRVNGFKVRLLDHEAELYIPMDRADEFLHGFGAKVRRELSDTELVKLKDRMRKIAREYHSK